MKHILLTLTLLFSLTSYGEDKKEILKIYGTEGPAPAFREAADAFAAANNVKVEVIAGPTEKWKKEAQKDADVVYSSSEHIIDIFNDELGIIDDKTITPLFMRTGAILVRKGNPKKIKGLKDLIHKDVKVIIIFGQGQMALWEDMVGRLKDIQAIADFRRHIAFSARASSEAVKYWQNHEEVDAWVTFNTWIKREDVPDVELVNIEKDLVVYRSTDAAVTTITNQREDSLKFIEYLKTPDAEKIFKNHGWFKKEK